MSGVSVCARICKCVYKLRGVGRGGWGPFYVQQRQILKETFLKLFGLFAVKIALSPLFANALLGNRREHAVRFWSSKGPKGHFNEVRHFIAGRCQTLGVGETRLEYFGLLWIFLPARVRGGRKRTVRRNEQQLEWKAIKAAGRSPRWDEGKRIKYPPMGVLLNKHFSGSDKEININLMIFSNNIIYI